MAARIAVGLVLLVAGAAKLGQPAWRATAAAFGAPRPLVPVLPWVELVLGALLVAGVGLPWTAWAAVALVVAFTAAVAARVRRGDAVPCGCFGETSPAPVGADTVVRNLVLCGAAVAAAAAGTDGGGPATAALGVGAAAVFLVAAGARSGSRRRR